MALIKNLAVGDEVIFAIGDKTVVSIVLAEQAYNSKGQVLKNMTSLIITADKSIAITTIGKNKIWLGTPALPVL